MLVLDRWSRCSHKLLLYLVISRDCHLRLIGVIEVYYCTVPLPAHTQLQSRWKRVWWRGVNVPPRLRSHLHTPFSQLITFSKTDNIYLKLFFYTCNVAEIKCQVCVSSKELQVFNFKSRPIPQTKLWPVGFITMAILRLFFLQRESINSRPVDQKQTCDISLPKYDLGKSPYRENTNQLFVLCWARFHSSRSHPGVELCVCRSSTAVFWSYRCPIKTILSLAVTENWKASAVDAAVALCLQQPH